MLTRPKDTVPFQIDLIATSSPLGASPLTWVAVDVRASYLARMVTMKPMLATPVATLPDGAGWAFEFKWDGVRALLDVSDRGVRLHSRNGNEVTAAYPELVSLAADVGDALIDGEIVALADGLPSFERLQTRMHVRDA